MANRTRWGILGLGNIAKQFARGLTAVSDGDLVACGSRTQPNADRFGDEFEVPSRHASYEALANDPEVDGELGLLAGIITATGRLMGTDSWS